MGAIAWLAGITHVSLARTANPFDIVGTELNVIAAVVLGAARITGGHGRVSGTILLVFSPSRLKRPFLRRQSLGFEQAHQNLLGCLDTVAHAQAHRRCVP